MGGRTKRTEDLLETIKDNCFFCEVIITRKSGHPPPSLPKTSTITFGEMLKKQQANKIPPRIQPFPSSYASKNNVTTSFLQPNKIKRSIPETMDPELATKFSKVRLSFDEGGQQSVSQRHLFRDICLNTLYYTASTSRSINGRWSVSGCESSSGGVLIVLMQISSIDI